jgi:hypothetical protein
MCFCADPPGQEQSSEIPRCRRVINFRDGPPLNWYFCEVGIGPWETDETADGVLETGSRPLGIDYSPS